LHHPRPCVAVRENGNPQANILDTERLLLRPLYADDADFIDELLNEPGFLQNIGDRGGRDTVDGGRYILALAGPAASYEQFGFGLYLVALKETTVPIGICGLLKRESMQDVERGFAFLERFWAKGYAYESAAAVMDYARTSLGLKRIVATTAPGNRGSIRVLEKLDLRFERTFSPAGTGAICMLSKDKVRSELARIVCCEGTRKCAGVQEPSWRSAKVLPVLEGLSYRL
jgi:[ribosomal protein S5]-alanine N-acetyltransferase